MSRRRFMTNTDIKYKIPDGFKHIEYIQYNKDAGPKVDGFTDVIFTKNNWKYFNIKFINNSSLQGNEWLIGGGNASISNFLIGTIPNFLFFGRNLVEYNIIFDDWATNKFIDFIYERNTNFVKANNQIYNINMYGNIPSGGICNENIIRGTLIRAGGNNSMGIIYSFNTKDESNNYLINVICLKRISDSRLFLYDTISNTFYEQTSSSLTSNYLIAGPDI